MCVDVGVSMLICRYECVCRCRCVNVVGMSVCVDVGVSML